MNVTLFGKRVLGIVNDLEIILDFLGGGLSPMTSVLIRGGKGHVKMGAEVGVLRLQAKEHPEPPETGKSSEGFLPS